MRVTKSGEVYRSTGFPGGYVRHDGPVEDILQLVSRGTPMAESTDTGTTGKKKGSKGKGKAKTTKKKAVAAKTNGAAKAKTGPKGPRGASLEGKKVRLLVKENPRRTNTRAWDTYALYKDGMLVETFIKAGGTVGDLRWDEKRKHIELY